VLASTAAMAPQPIGEDGTARMHDSLACVTVERKYLQRGESVCLCSVAAVLCELDESSDSATAENHLGALRVLDKCGHSRRGTLPNLSGRRSEQRDETWHDTGGTYCQRVAVVQVGRGVICGNGFKRLQREECSHQSGVVVRVTIGYEEAR
jgi:hypothetical protein